VTRTLRIVVLFLGLCAGGPDSLLAAPQETGAKPTSIDVGFDMGEAGRTVSVPIELKAPDGVRVSATINEVTFPSKLFTLEEVRPSPVVEADVKSAVKQDEKDAANSVVQVTVTAKQGSALPNGILASLVFKIADDAKESRVVKLKNVARAMTAAAPPAPIEPVTGKDGEIELLGSAPTAVLCFFYMH
jgi:hypothetical protein